MADNTLAPPMTDDAEELRRWREEVCAFINGDQTSSSSSTTPFVADTPTVPTGLAATGGFGIIVLVWDTATYTGHSHTEIWHSTTDDAGTASPIGTSITNTYTHPLSDPATSVTHYYWARHINKNGESSSLTVLSVSGTADTSATYALEVLVGQLGYDQFAPGTVPIRVVDPLPNLPDADYPIDTIVYLSSDGKLYSNVANVWEAYTSDVADNSITAGKIAAGAIVADKIGSNEIITQAANIGNGVITSAKIGTGEIKTANIEDASINNVKIANGAVGSINIVDGAVTTAKIGTAAITEAKIGTAAVTNAKIGNAAITTAKINDLAVQTAKIDDDAVTVPVNAYTAASTAVGNTEVILQSASLDSQGQPVEIKASCCYVSDGGIRFRIYRGVTLIYDSDWVVSSLYYDGSSYDYFAAPYSVSIGDTPSSGTTTYYFVAIRDGGTASVRTRSLTLAGMKK